MAIDWPYTITIVLSIVQLGCAIAIVIVARQIK